MALVNLFFARLLPVNDVRYPFVVDCLGNCADTFEKSIGRSRFDRPLAILARSPRDKFINLASRGKKCERYILPLPSLGRFQPLNRYQVYSVSVRWPANPWLRRRIEIRYCADRWWPELRRGRSFTPPSLNLSLIYHFTMTWNNFLKIKKGTIYFGNFVLALGYPFLVGEWGGGVFHFCRMAAAHQFHHRIPQCLPLQGNFCHNYRKFIASCRRESVMGPWGSPNSSLLAFCMVKS